MLRDAVTTVLIGFMGSGKSTVGRLLADALGVGFVDSDTAIERAAGRTITEIFAADGELAFRTLEHEVIADLIGSGNAGVVALGGGAAMHAGTRRLLAERARVVHLKVSLPRALERVGADPARPMLARPDLAELYTDRIAAYDRIADVVVDADDRDAEEVAAELAGPADRGTTVAGDA